MVPEVPAKQQAFGVYKGVYTGNFTF